MWYSQADSTVHALPKYAWTDISLTYALLEPSVNKESPWCGGQVV